MSGPANSRIANGVRVYTWAEPGREPVEVMSVTSIRRMTGIPFTLSNWMVSNVTNLATGTRRAEWRDFSKSKRGRLVKGYKPDGEFPGEFVRRMLETEGAESKVAEVRQWLTHTADEPRDVAAVRGTVVHKMIEIGIPMATLTEDMVRLYIVSQWKDERRAVLPAVTDEDVRFCLDSMRNYWDMRAKVPFVILAKEPQVWNLSIGYAGSADGIFWFLPEDTSAAEVATWQSLADKGGVTLQSIQETGGSVVLGDWKTSEDTYLDHAVQVTAYSSAEFVGSDGVRDERLTAILRATQEAAIVHVRPDKWDIQFIPWREDVAAAFIGSCVFARFLAMNTLDGLVTRKLKGEAE